MDPYLLDLKAQVDDELRRQTCYTPTDAEILDGAVALDPRNFADPNTTRSLAQRKLIAKWGDRQQGVQYYTLTPTGLALVRQI